MDRRIGSKLAARIAAVVLGILVFASTVPPCTQAQEEGIIEKGVFKLDFRKGGSRSWGRLFFKGEELFGSWAGFGLRDKDNKTGVHDAIFQPSPEDIEQKEGYVEVKSSRTYEEVGYTHTVRVKLYQENKVKIIIESKFSKDWNDGGCIFILPSLSSSILLNARYKAVDTRGEETEGMFEAHPDGKWILFPPQSGKAARKMEVCPVRGGRFTFSWRCASAPEGGFKISHGQDSLRLNMSQHSDGFPAGYYNQIELTIEYNEEAGHPTAEETNA